MKQIVHSRISFELTDKNVRNILQISFINIGIPVIRAICETLNMSLSLFRESIIAFISLKFATSSKIRGREIFQ